MSTIRTAQFDELLQPRDGGAGEGRRRPSGRPTMPERPRQRSVSVDDTRHGRSAALRRRAAAHPGRAPSAAHRQRARAQMLDNWDDALAQFVKVMPTDYAKALTDMQARAPRRRCGIEASWAKITGFLEIERQDRAYEKPEARLKNYKEFVHAAADARGRPSRRRAAWIAAFPFCHQGCPVNNLIPDWNDLVYRDQWRDGVRDAALDQQLPGVHRPHLPGAVRGGLHAEHQSTTRSPSRPSNARSSIAAGKKAGSSRVAAGAEDRQDGGGGGLRPRRPGRGPAAGARRPRRHAVREERPHRRPAALRHSRLQDGKAPDRPPHAQMEAEGVVFRTSVEVGVDRLDASMLLADYDAVVLAGGAEAAARSARCRAASWTASISPWIS